MKSIRERTSAGDFTGKSHKFSDFSPLVLILFIAFSFLIYLPVLDHYFVSDDFKVLYRVCIEKIIFIKRFFRPLSDISIFLNYKMGGLNPIFFNSFNILIHSINVYLVYLISLLIGDSHDKKKTKSFAIISSVLFLFYPFHNEAIVWMLGRGASMASLFALWAMVSFYTTKGFALKHWTVCFLYFISLSAFESTIFFPIIFCLILFYERQTRTTIGKWLLWLTLTLAIHLLIRKLIAGSVFGSYGGDFFHAELKTYFINIAKIGGRFFFPPTKNVLLLTGLFFLFNVLTFVLVFINRAKIKRNEITRPIFFVSAMLLISCIIPVFTGVSTQTSETDRMLYFPSVFLCMIAGMLIVYTIKENRIQFIITMLLIMYSLFFLERNNANWKKASLITFSIVEKIKESKLAKNNGRIFFLNIPNEIEGAYVFRLGYHDALKLYGFDSSQYFAVNYLMRQDLEKVNEKTVLKSEKTVITVPPDIFLKENGSGCQQIFDHSVLKFNTLQKDRIFFWNLDILQNIPNCKHLNP